jgi:hypothetical protein
MSQDTSLFAMTHWSVVVVAGDAGSTQAREALERLCQTYWYRLYAYVRRLGRSPHDAQDLTQEFFLQLLEHCYLARADPRKGRFRSFLPAILSCGPRLGHCRTSVVRSGIPGRRSYVEGLAFSVDYPPDPAASEWCLAKMGASVAGRSTKVPCL